MSLFPAFLNLRGRRVLLVGGGTVAARKLGPLREAGAIVEIVAAALGPSINAQLGNDVIWLARAFDEAQLDAVWLVIAATDDRALNQRVACAADARRVWCNVVDDSALCSYQSPARVRRGTLQIAISSGATAPMLATHAREKIEREFDDSWSLLSVFLAAEAERIRTRIADTAARRVFYQRLFDSPLKRLLETAQNLAAERLFEALLNAPVAVRGFVAIVGAGPGDAGLLTLRALEHLKRADVILCDQLVSAAVRDLCRRDAELIDVGKHGSGARTEQADIHALLLEHARAGRYVVRLKGGDPLIFGRGGEEAQVLKQAGIDYAIVPGVTAALASAAYAGIPLTHRGLAQSVRMITAHCQQSIDSLDWRELAHDRQTLAVYMGVARIETLAGMLLAHGRQSSTPCAFVENASRPEQRTVLCTLSTLAATAERERINAPCLLMIGNVSALAAELHWFGKLIDRRPKFTPASAPVEPMAHAYAY
jgi:uroporphyrin-III C-methyltransferase / precorrin-2 dehydrogenase / sirohydrochlorin ferrochelatase